MDYTIHHCIIFQQNKQGFSFQNKIVNTPLIKRSSCILYRIWNIIIVERRDEAEKINAYQEERGVRPTEAQRNCITPPHFTRKTNRKFILINRIYVIDSDVEAAANMPETKRRRHARA